MAAADRTRDVPVVVAGAGPAGLVAAVTTGVRFGTELAAFAQDTGGITVTLRERATGAERLVRAGYLVGADGAHSRVRAGLGIAMDGPDHLAEHLTVLFEAPLAGVVGDRRYGIYFIQHPGAGGLFVPNGAPGPVAVRPHLGPRAGAAGGLHRRPADRPHPHGRRGRRPAGPVGGQGLVLVRGPGRRALPGGSRVPGRRRRPAHDPAHRDGHEHRRGRGPRPRLEARLGLRGWAGPALLGTYKAEWRPVGARRAARSALEGPAPAWAGDHTTPFPLEVHTLDSGTADVLGVGAAGAVLVRPDAQVVTCWPAAPPDPRAALAAAVPWSAEPAGSRR